MKDGIRAKSRCKHVLVLEDNAIVALDIETALGDAGFMVFVADSVATGQQALQHNAFDCALLDYHLSDGSSTALAIALGAQGCPVAIVSGIDPAAISRGLAEPHIFRKPVEAYELVAWALMVTSAIA